MLEALNDFRVTEDDFLHVDGLRLPGTVCANLAKDIDANQPVLITCGDETFDDPWFARLDRPGVKLWLAQNCLCRQPKMWSLPLGLPDQSHDPLLGNAATFSHKNETAKNTRNLVYLGFRDDTYPSVRGPLRQLFESRNFTTTTPYDRTPAGHAAYIDNLYHHTFVLSPRGNGFDCHRTWEALYLRSIPIVMDHPVISFAHRLPILFVQNWEQALDENFLHQEARRIHALKYDFSILRLSYWTQLIRQHT